MALDHRSVDPGDHTAGPWHRLPKAEEAQHGRPVWRRDCSTVGCSWAQCTVVDPASPDHPEAQLVRVP